MVNALGTDLATIYRRLMAGDTSQLGRQRLRTAGEEVPVGRVPGELPTVPEHLIRFNCRNHRLALMAYLQIADQVQDVIARYGAHRVGVVLGSSTSGVDATEEAYFCWKETGSVPQTFDYKHQHDMGSISRFIKEMVQVSGPAYTISTACSSSAKVFAAAKGLLDLNLCDAVITGGVDSLCHLTLDGFESLGSLSRNVSNPMSKNRDGLNIGEGAAIFVMSRGEAAIGLFGVGESCDAYHMSAPQPDGIGAEAAMNEALKSAGIQPKDIAYLNLHGTGTPLNDSMEAKAVYRTFENIPCSSTKPLIGHTLGVAGAMEVGFCWLTMTGTNGSANAMPPHIWDQEEDARFPSLNLVTADETLCSNNRSFVMSNSFAFGGNNCSVIIGIS